MAPGAERRLTCLRVEHDLIRLGNVLLRQSTLRHPWQRWPSEPRGPIPPWPLPRRPPTLPPRLTLPTEDPQGPPCHCVLRHVRNRRAQVFRQ